MLKKIQAVLFALFMGFAGLAMAQTAPDMTPLSSGIDFSTVIEAVLGIAALLATVYVAVKGAKIALAMLKGS